MTDMDHIFRKKLSDHESQLPTDMWSKIELGLREEKPERTYLWIVTIGFTLLICITASFIYLDANSAQEPDIVQNLIIHSEVVPVKITSNSVTKLTDSQNVTTPTETFPDNQANSIKEKESINFIETSHQPTFKKKDKRTQKLFRIRDGSSKILDRAPIGFKMPALASSKEPSSNNQRIKTIKAITRIPQRDLKVEASKLNMQFEPVICYGFSKKKRIPNLFIETHYNPLLALSLLSSISSEIGNDYLNLRRNTESALYSWSAGFNIGWVSNFNFGLKGGLNFEQINERFSYQDPDAIRNQTIIVIDTVFNTDGTFIINSDTSTIQVSGVEMLQIHNYHRNIEIPLNLLYQIDMGDMAMEISGGPVINLKYSNRGKIVDPANNDQWFTNGENGAYQVFKDRLSVSFNLSVSALYNMNENVQLYVRPNFKFHPDTWSRNTSPFNQKYANIGLAAGVRYYFSGNPNF